MMLSRWWKWHLTVERRHIRHLEREILYWRQCYQHERQRAELAIDQCRSYHQHLPPVSQPLRPEHEADVAKDIRDILNQPEMALIGAAEGVGR